jgi:hypothetical protein
MRLYVDDLRTPPDGWHLARTIREAIDILSTQPVEEVSLDFMIADRFEDNFLPVALFMINLPPEKRPRRVYIHTSSAEGARQLQMILSGYIDDVVRI